MAYVDAFIWLEDALHVLLGKASDIAAVVLNLFLQEVGVPFVLLFDTFRGAENNT